MHISKMIEEASKAVTNVQVVQGNVLMKLMQDKSFTQEQKQELVEALKPIEAAINEAQVKFAYEV
jgi:hypothetical protein